MSLQCEISVPDPIPSGYPLGIDLNLANFLATSDGKIIARPRFLSLLSRKIKLASDPASSVSGRTPRRRQAHLVADRARERASYCNAD